MTAPPAVGGRRTPPSHLPERLDTAEAREVLAQPTLVHRLLAQADAQGQKAALRRRQGPGRWEETTWEGYRAAGLRVASGLRSLGIERRSLVALLSGNRPSWVQADMGILSADCVSVPAYPNSTPDQVEYLLAHSGAQAVFVADPDQLRKVQAVWGRCPELRYAVVLDHAAGVADGERVLSWEQLLGRATTDLGPADALARQVDPDSLATIIYTSGTTGPPKGAMLSHRNLVAMADAGLTMLRCGPGDASLSFLPLSHVAERLQGEIVAISAGYTVNFGDGLDTIIRDLREVNATILVCVPRLWEKIHAQITASLEDAPRLRRRIFTWARDVGSRHHQAVNGGGSPGALLAAQVAVADRLVAGPLKARLGMAHVHTFLSGAAPLSKELGEFFASLGIIIQEVYGQTEGTGVSNANRPDHVKFGTVGPVLPGLELRIAQDGEILVRGETVFMGYYRQPEATAETVVDGWLHTGDVGEVDGDGFLRITDRKKDIIVTAGGKNVSPQNIEGLLKPKRGISQAVVIGDKRKYLTCLFTLDLEDLGRLIEEVGSAESAASDPRVLALIQGYVEEVNATLASYETIKRFRVLERDFTVEGGELTPSLKVKRRVIQRTYEAAIDALYDEKYA